MSILGIVGIFIGFFIVTFFTYKGLNLAITVMLAVLVVLITNGLPILSTFADPILTGVAEQVPTLLPLYLFGGIFGKLYLDAGASHKLSKTLLDVFGKDKSPATRGFIGLVIVIVIGTVFTYVGVDPFATLFIMLGLGTGICAAANIPRRFLPVMLVLGTTLGSGVPGSSSAPNVILSNILAGTTSRSAWGAGLVYCVIVVGFSFIFLYRQLSKDYTLKRQFEYGPLEPPVEMDLKECPPFILTIIPLIVAPVCSNTICSGYAWAGMALGCVAAIICFGKYIPKAEGKNRIMTVVNSLNDGVTLAGIPAIIILNYALGYAMEAAPGFTVIQNFFTSMPGAPLIVLAIMGIVLLGISASMSGLLISANIAATVYIPDMAVSADAAYRVLLCTNTVLDSLPFCAAVSAMFFITGIKYKDGYPLVFMTTVIATFIGTMAAAFVLTLFS